MVNDEELYQKRISNMLSLLQVLSERKPSPQTINVPLSSQAKTPFTLDRIEKGSTAIRIRLDAINFYDVVYIGSDPKLFCIYKGPGQFVPVLQSRTSRWCI